MIRSLVLFILITALLIAPVFAPYDPYTTDPVNQLTPPNALHLFGTDLLGRDVLSRWLHGGARTLSLALLATSVGLSIGLMFGIITGANKTGVTLVIDVFMRALLSLPALMIALVFVTLLGSGGATVAVAVGLAQVAPTSQVIRTAVEIINHADYVMAARGMGASSMRLMRFVLIPNIAPILRAYGGVVFGYCLLNAAALNFLGLGGEPSTPDWGMMLYEGRVAFRTAPWIALFPGLAITMTVILVSWATQDRPRG